MIYKKITWDEIVKLIKDTYKIKNVNFIILGDFGEKGICEIPEYVIGEEVLNENL